ncbi:MAG TPA: fibronectin type III domain-containing protein, partial [Candidatus Limnocylindria bacterium]|nr:fibronectin type III domain-containing protein [Candidatus Limnocylindria bacterium]
MPIDRRAPRHRSAVTGLLLAGLLVVTLGPVTASAAGPIASSSFVGAENPLSENGAWVALTSLAPNGGRFQKNNGALPNSPSPDIAGARTTAVVPADQYSEIVVGHTQNASQVGPIVRVQTSGASVESHYLWWASDTTGQNSLYRIDANGSSFTVRQLIPTSPVADGDRLRLIARGQVIYGIKNGVRDFIYNTGRDATKYAGGTTGMLAFAQPVVTNAKIASWSTDAAPVSAGTWASTNFAGVENPLDEGDRWYPLPGYSGFKKAGGLASGRDFGHNATGVWGINAPARQYSQVTLGTVTGGSGGGPIVRIDRNNPGHSGWLLYLSLEVDVQSGIYKMNPDQTHTLVRPFSPVVVSGDKWRLAADGATLEVFRNGVSQFTFTTDGTYPNGDPGMEAFTAGFTYVGWEGGDLAGGGDTSPPTAPSNLSAAAMSSTQVDLSWTASTDNVGVKDYQVERCAGAGCTNFVSAGTATGTTFSDGGRAPNTTYRYQVRATDAAGNLSAYSNVASATTPNAPDTSPPTAPSNLTATAMSATEVDLSWTASTDNVGVKDYQVERCTGAGCTNFAFAGTTTGTTYSDGGRAASTSY